MTLPAHGERPDEPGFIDAQKQRLLTLRGQLRAAREREHGERSSVNEASRGQANDFEDDAQRLAAVELAEDVVAADDARMQNIERALRKIEEGTYGLSDLSGTPIPRERLLAAPEALLTLEEQRQREGRR